MFNAESNTIIIPQPSLYIYCCALPLAATKTEELHLPIVRSNQSHVLDLTVITILSLLPLSALIKVYCRVEELLLDSAAATWLPAQFNCSFNIPYLTRSLLRRTTM